MRERVTVVGSVVLMGCAVTACQAIISGELGDYTTSASGSSGTGASSASSAHTSSSGTEGAGAGANSSTSSTEPATGSSTASTGASSSGAVVSCMPIAGETAAPNDECGVFVSSSLGSDGGTGSMKSPYLTIGQAVLLAASNGHPIYVCGESTPFTETVTSSTENLTIYGGMQCHSGWTFPTKSATPSSLTSTADTIPLTLNASATISTFDIIGPASANLGGSSIAMVFGGTSLTLDNVSISAQAGNPGADADPWDGGAQFGATAGSPTSTSCDGGYETGGAGSVNFCAGVFIVGGTGGFGGPGGPGSNGTMGTVNGTPAGGIGGDGGSSVPGSCTNGGAGDAGDPGAPTPAPIGLGTIGGNGYLGPTVPADAGFAGSFGLPGGGGGGAQGACGSGPLAGGGGGAGGCGGNPGFPGNPGGSSIGLVLLSSNVSLNATNVTISTAAGGAGGVGGPGQFGGVPGSGGGGLSGPNPGCAGGSGGKGGQGGPGPGGAGGHSVGIAVNGAMAPNTTGITFTPVVDGGAPRAAGGYGAGVDAGSGAFDGPPGQSCQLLGFGLVLDAGAFDGGNLCLL